MEIMAAAFAAAIVVGWMERRDRRRMFPDGPCRWCDQWIYFDGDRWYHEDGEQYARWPKLDYETFPDNPLHPAAPQHQSMTPPSN